MDNRHSGLSFGYITNLPWQPTDVVLTDINLPG
jgi:hypothetical protein